MREEHWDWLNIPIRRGKEGRVRWQPRGKGKVSQCTYVRQRKRLDPVKKDHGYGGNFAVVFQKSYVERTNVPWREGSRWVIDKGQYIEWEG
jgi:hypothetical protein